eukprot:TRINITY_DN4042_c0_g2_i1.p1 TRINITY_DN4042_c0_g2~~TRINITY_DN4042_c0_g2_i1.p1  ORF type:complete len:1353 (+),score=398.96 TRINITY_DN4042_c0_g2_i1:109-4167(+)
MDHVRGELCYFSNADGRWLLGTVVEWDVAARRGVCISCSKAHSERVEVTVGQVLPVVDDIDALRVDDLTQGDGHAGTILHALLQRFREGRPETRLGTMLVSMNPRGPKALQKYSLEALEEFDVFAPGCEPSFWSVASRAYRALLITRRPQHVYTFGISGSGQSEAARCVNRVLAHKFSGCAGLGKAVGFVGMVLDCFTCAGVPDGSNSSRAHRTAEWLYSLEPGYVGPETTPLPSALDAVTMKTRLLELDRVVMDWTDPVGDSREDRSFHAFYLLLHSKALCAELGLPTRAGEYRNLRSGALRNRDFDSAEEWDEVGFAMEALGWSPVEVGVIWGCIGAILHLQHEDIADPAPRLYTHQHLPRRHLDRLSAAATALSIPPELLWNCPDVDAFCKALYSSLVLYVEQLCNRSLGQVVGTTKIEAAEAAMQAGGEADVSDARRVRINPIPTTTTSICVTDGSGLRETDSASPCSYGQLLLNTAHEALKSAYQQHWFRDYASKRSVEGVRSERMHFEAAAHDNRPTLSLLLGAGGAVQCVEDAGDDAQIVQHFRTSRFTADSHQELPHLGGDPSKVHLKHSTKDFCCYRLTRRCRPDLEAVQQAVAASLHPVVRQLPRAPELGHATLARVVSELKESSETGDLHWILCAEFASQERLAKQIEHFSLPAVHGVQRASPVAYPRDGFVQFYGVLRMTDDYAAASPPHERPHVVVGGADPRGSQNARQNNTTATTPAPPAPLDPVTPFNPIPAHSEYISPRRPLYRQVPGTDPVPTRWPLKCPATPEALLKNANIGMPREAQVGIGSVFLSVAALDKLEGLRYDAETQHAAVVQAFCRAAATKARIQEVVKESHSGVVEELRQAVRRALQAKQAMLELEVDEGKERAEAEEEQTWGLINIAVDYAEGFGAAQLAEVVRHETELREARIAEEDAAWAARVRRIATITTEQLAKEELITRGEMMEDEFLDRIAVFREFEAEWFEVMLQDEQMAEEAAREDVEMHEAHGRASLLHHHCEQRKPIVELEEARARMELCSEEATAWAEAVEEMMALYMEQAVDELEMDEELARFGYRGVGGIFHDEQKAWRESIMQPLAAALVAFIAQQGVDGHPGIERRYRSAIADDERRARGALLHDYKAQQLAFQYKYYYADSLKGRDAIVDEEWRARKGLFETYATEKVRLLEGGYGWEAEPAQRKLIEKVQRDATRRLYTTKLLLYVAVQEGVYRTLMRDLHLLQWQEMRCREEAARAQVEAAASLRGGFEAGRRVCLDMVREDVYDQMRRDDTTDEFLRRHYVELGDIQADTERLMRRTARSLDRAEAERRHDAEILRHEWDSHRTDIDAGYQRSLMSHAVGRPRLT